MTPRTFSLARLLVGVTVLCLLCGFAVNFPLLSAMFIPPLVAWLVLTRFSRRRVKLFMYITVGAIVAVYFVWLTIRTLPPVDIRDAQGWEPIAAIAIATTACALAAGGTALLDELVHRYVTPKDERLDQPRPANRLPGR